MITLTGIPLNFATTESHGDARFRFWAKINGIPLRFIIDSGSSRNVLNGLNRSVLKANWTNLLELAVR
jgi:hypothetical protein